MMHCTTYAAVHFRFLRICHETSSSKASHVALESFDHADDGKVNRFLHSLSGWLTGCTALPTVMISTDQVFHSQDAIVCCGVDMLAQQGEALDVIVVYNADNTDDSAACSDFVVQFTGMDDSSTNSNYITVTVNGSLVAELKMRLMEKGCRFIVGESLKPPSFALQSLRQRLIKGKNSIRYSLMNESNQLLATAQANLYLWSSAANIIVCDIDGTITKSNARGVLDTMVLESYAHVHDGVCDFLRNIQASDESLQLLYLTSRPLSYAQSTRRFLEGLRQDQQKLPDGPLFMHPGTLGTVLFGELVTKDMHTYKSDVLMRQVVLTFAAAGREATQHLLVAGFGNALSDSVAYEMAGMDRQNIYMIDKKSMINCMDKSEAHAYCELIWCESKNAVSRHVQEASNESFIVGNRLGGRGSLGAFKQERH